MGRSDRTARGRAGAGGGTLSADGRGRPGQQLAESRVFRRVVEGRTHHLARLRTPPGAEQQFSEAQGRRGMGRIGFQRAPIARFRFRGPPQHLQHQGAVRQRPGAGWTGSAVEHLAKERQRPRRIAAHREGGGGVGADAGRDSLAARVQHPIEERRGPSRVASPQARVSQPARGAQRGAAQRFTGRRNEGRQNLGGGGQFAHLQVRPRPADFEGRIAGVSSRRRPYDAGRLHDVAPVQQQSHQCHPAVPTSGHQPRGTVYPGPAYDGVLVEPGEQQVQATGLQPTLLVTGEEPPAFGCPTGIGILGEQLAQPEAHRGIVRRFCGSPAELGNRLLAEPEAREQSAQVEGRPRRRPRRRSRGFKQRQRTLVVAFGQQQTPALERRRR